MGTSVSRRQAIGHFRMKLAGCFVMVVAFCVLVSASSAFSKRSKRSVNFTPSWGKRSGGFNSYSSYDVPATSNDERCQDKEVVLNLLVERLKMELENLSDCMD